MWARHRSPSLPRRGQGEVALTLHFNKHTERTKRQTLRNNAPEAERRLLQQLKGAQRGTKFHRQYGVNAYVLDFYAVQSKLAIEIDGDSHFTADAVAYDQRRTAYLKSFGIEVLRFANVDVFENLAGVLARIEDVLRARRATSPLAPSLVRRGTYRRFCGATCSPSAVGASRRRR